MPQISVLKKKKLERLIALRSKHPEQYPFKCPFCEWRNTKKWGLTVHVKREHLNRFDEYRPPKSVPYDDEMIMWIENKSIENILLSCNGNINNLTRTQAMFLLEHNLIERKYAPRTFTIKGLTLWKEIQHEEKEI